MTTLTLVPALRPEMETDELTTLDRNELQRKRRSDDRAETLRRRDARRIKYGEAS